MVSDNTVSNVDIYCLVLFFFVCLCRMARSDYVFSNYGQNTISILYRMYYKDINTTRWINHAFSAWRYTTWTLSLRYKSPKQCRQLIIQLGEFTYWPSTKQFHTNQPLLHKISPSCPLQKRFHKSLHTMAHNLKRFGTAFSTRPSPMTGHSAHNDSCGRDVAVPARWSWLSGMEQGDNFRLLCFLRGYNFSFLIHTFLICLAIPKNSLHWQIYTMINGLRDNCWKNAKWHLLDTISYGWSVAGRQCYSSTVYRQTWIKLTSGFHTSLNYGSKLSRVRCVWKKKN